MSTRSVLPNVAHWSMGKTTFTLAMFASSELDTNDVTPVVSSLRSVWPIGNCLFFPSELG